MIALPSRIIVSFSFLNESNINYNLEVLGNLFGLAEVPSIELLEAPSEPVVDAAPVAVLPLPRKKSIEKI